MNGGTQQFARVLQDTIRNAAAAQQRFSASAANPCVSDDTFRAHEDAALNGRNAVRDTLGSMGLSPTDINQLGEVLA